MDIKKIIMPDGKMRTFYRGDDQTWSEIIENVVLPVWQEYCNEHWIDHANHESMWSFEKRTKAFLDRAALLILLDKPSGIESSYKAMTHLVREIPASECPAEVEDWFYSERIQPISSIEEQDRFELLLNKLDEADKRPKRAVSKKKHKTRFDRIAEIQRKYPAAKRTWCRVNAENQFDYKGSVMTIPTNIVGYEADVNKTDLMDRILIVDDGTNISYYDQNVFPICMAG